MQTGCKEKHMKNFNTALIIAALVREPELRYTPGGLPGLTFQLGGDQTVMDNNGEFKTSPFYIRAEFMGKEAENLSDTLKAGSVVAVEGKIEYQSWEIPSGEKRSRVMLRALSIQPFAEGQHERLVADRIGGYRLSNAINTITMSGNLTKDVALRHTESGSPVANMTLAINESWKDSMGNWQERTHYVEVTAWDDLAREVAQLSKGSSVLITGKLNINSWTTPDGEKRSNLEVTADRVEVLAARKAKAQAVAVDAVANETPAASIPTKRASNRRATA
jgi:single-strand DNA-binding protein